MPDRDLQYYVDLACGQLRRFGAAEPTILIALLRMLRDLATAVKDDQQRRIVRQAAERIDVPAGSRPPGRRMRRRFMTRATASLPRWTAEYARRTGTEPEKPARSDPCRHAAWD